ncbi:putative serine/threonine-protein kinase receptor [Hordeum vulgare]|nr:putative serine/threonine-protein kinase receptor [Hordeum vulgare]
MVSVCGGKVGNRDIGAAAPDGGSWKEQVQDLSITWLVTAMPYRICVFGEDNISPYAGALTQSCLQEDAELQARPHLQNNMHLLPIVFTLLFFLRAPASSVTTDTILAGQALAVNDKLVSKNGRYALGFFNTSSSKPSQDTTNWYLGISFNTVPKFTSAWVANRDKPIKNTTTPELTISHDGNLVIINQSTKSIIWSTQANITRNSTTAMLLSSGNLILTDSSNSSEVLWQSFDHPTDTLFPGAKLGWDKLTGLNRRLVSWKNLNDPTTGLYCDGLDPSGLNQFLLTALNSSIPYWSTGVWNGKYFASLPEMKASNPVFTATFVSNNREKYSTVNVVDESMVTRNVIDVSGQRKTFIWLEGSQDWTMIYAQPKLQCDVYAICGPFTICNNNALPHCKCMEGFTITSPKDWELEDQTSGCSRNTPLDCISNKSTTHSTDKFYSVPCVELPQNTLKVEAAASTNECARICLRNCSCTAYSFTDERCSIWHTELLNIRALQCSGTTNSTGETLYLRVSANDFHRLKNNRKGIVIGVATATGISVLCLFALILLVMIRRNKSKSSSRILDGVQGCNRIIAFRYTDLQRATTKFTDKLGAGSFGSVFKGFLNESTAIAVKRLDGAYQGEKQFRAEVSSIGAIQHINLVKLLGFCCEGSKRLLVYEHMPNRSLDVHLFGNNSTTLNWTVSGVAITPKVDVYSYGMMLLEIISGKRNSWAACTSGGNLDVYFPVHAAQKLLEGDVGSLIDHKLHGDINLVEVELACKVACWCIQDNELDRPTMGHVVQILQGLVEIRMPPIPKHLEAMT